MKKKSGGSRLNPNSKGFIAILTIVVLAIAIAGGLYYAVQKNKPKDVLASKTSFDLTDESKEAHKALDDILLQKKETWQLQESGREDVTERLAETGGEVTWNRRQLSIGLPITTDFTGAADWLKDRLRGTDIIVLGERQATYQTWPSYRLDLGIEVKAGAGKKTFTTATIYFFHNGNLVKEDKDIKEPKKKPEPEPKKPVKKYKGRLAVVIDDCGYNLAPLRELLKTELPFSYAVIPYKDYSSDALHMIKNNGQEAMLHMPMEPVDPAQLSEKGRTVLTSMSAKEQQSMVLSALDSLPGVSGVNNHQGSKATSDEATMKAVLTVLKNQGMFFLDSNTSAHSIGMQEARRLGIPTNKNLLFLDNVADVESIHARMIDAMELADRYGSAIVICHARPATAKAWTYYGSEVKKSGIELVPVSRLLK